MSSKTPQFMQAVNELVLTSDVVRAYLPGTGDSVINFGGAPRARPFHCASVGLTLAITPNVGNSGA